MADWFDDNSEDNVPRFINLFPCSTQLSMKFKFLVNTEIAQINGNFLFRPSKPVIYPAVKC